MIRLYTIGFTEKSAERFFQLLEKYQVKKILDTRVSNSSQLSGFAKGKDLAFFAKRLANINYEHRIDFAPFAIFCGHPSPVRDSDPVPAQPDQAKRCSYPLCHLDLARSNS